MGPIVSNALTEAQLRVLNWVKEFIRKEQFPPTRKEIAEGLGFASPNAAEAHLCAIAAKGYVTIKSGISRGLIVHEVPIENPSVGIQSVDQLRSEVAYEPETGIFRSRSTGKRIDVQKTNVGCRRCVRIFGVVYNAARLAWFYVHAKWPEEVIDHINGDPSDNRIANLRDVSQSFNAQNRTKVRVNTQSGLLGVKPNRNSKTKPWQAQIRLPLSKSATYLGCFATAEEAHEAYLAAKREHHPGNTL